MKSSKKDWMLHWESPQCPHQYEPLYLANTHFGGLLDLTGTDMNLWSACIAGLQERSSKEHEGILFPVTAIRTQVYYRNQHFRKEGFWVSHAGILCDRPEYIHHEAMPHLAQVYENRQCINLREGIASTSGVVFPGSYSSLKSGAHDERAISFSTRVAFLKNAPILGMWIDVEEGTDVLFDPLPVLDDIYVLKNTGKSIYTLGNEIDANVCVHQEMVSCHTAANRIEYRFQPNGGEEYSVVICAQEASIIEHSGRPCFVANGSVFITVAIFVKNQISQEVQREWDKDTFFNEQKERWTDFWGRSEVIFPKSKSEWQQRYRISLFYVAQSVNDAPIHPVGLSKPMIPYWYGSFHDTDTYFCRPLLESGHGEQALKYLNYRYRTLAKAFEIAAEDSSSGARFPWQSDPVGNGERRDTPMNHAIIAVEAWHHFAHTGDKDALVKAHAILEGVLENLLDNVDEAASILCLVDEYLNTFSETLKAKNAGEIVIAVRSVASHYLKACELVHKRDDNLGLRAHRVLNELEIPFAPDGSYAILRDADPEYMRCPSMTLGSFPLHCLPSGEAMAKTFDKELSRVVSLFSWMPQQLSIVASQLGKRGGAHNAWQLLNDSLVYDKTWFAVDEWENRRTVRPQIFVTCAGGHCSAIHAMMIAETGEKEWTVFSGIPSDWQEASFKDLRTRAGWRVSATLKEGKVVSVGFSPEHPYAEAGLKLRVPNAYEDIVIDAPFAQTNWDGGVLILLLRHS